VNEPVKSCWRTTALADDHGRNRQDKKQDAECNRQPEKGFLNAAASRKHTARIGPGQTTQASTLALQDDEKNQDDRRYNQCDIQKRLHVLPPEIESARQFLP
jgi:hypothetical protein